MREVLIFEYRVTRNSKGSHLMYRYFYSRGIGEFDYISGLVMGGEGGGKPPEINLLFPCIKLRDYSTEPDRDRDKLPTLETMVEDPSSHSTAAL